MDAFARLKATGLLKRSNRRVFRKTGTAGELRADLAAIHAAQHAKERRMQGYKRLRIGGVVVGLGLLGLSVSARAEEGVAIGAALAVLSLVGFGFLRWRMNFYDGRRIGLVRMLLHELAIPAGAPVELSLDLAAPAAGWKRAGKEHHMKMWRDPWLSLSAPLEGGAHVRIERVETFGEQVQHELNQIITHTRVQNLDGLELHAGPSQALRPPPDLRPRVPRGVTVTGLQGDARALRVELASGKDWSIGSNAQQRGLIDVMAAYGSVLGALAGAAGLPSPFLAEPHPWAIEKISALGPATFFRSLG
ncbi:MAG: hypothetical protein AAGH15_01425 [Myxococcota bacterium]